MTREFVTNSAEETVTLGSSLALQFPEIPLFLISGDFGVGKTTFIKGLASGLLFAGQETSEEVRSEVQAEIKSPSFTLVNEYPYGERRVYHADFYRLHSERDLDFIDFDEVLREGNSRVIIEWFDKIPLLETLQKSFPHVVLEVRFLSDSERKIIVTD